MSLISVLPLFAGIGLFLFGMSVLGAALEKIAGASLEKMLERLTSSRPKGVFLGTAVTGIIQSSSATTIMVVGLINAGIMKLSNAIPVVMGANIGTTVTGQILRLGDIGDSGVILSLLKPSSFGPILIGIGAALYVFSRAKRKKDIGTIMLGLGMIFFGMSTMETTLSPLKEIPQFTELFFIFENPILGILLGMVMTAILQSSSASVGILQALSSTGALTFSTAVPIILGQNVGKCITVILASFGSKRDAKRVVFTDVLTNIIGMTMFFVIIYGLNSIIHFTFWDSVVNRGDIANFHTFFNIATTIALLPFVDILIKISDKAIKKDDISVEEKDLALLDDLLLKTPTLAVEQARKVLNSMAALSLKNFKRSMTLFSEYSERTFEKVERDENLIDRFETALGNYLLKITAADINETSNDLVVEMLHSVGDFERISDHCMNVAEVAKRNHENNIAFSKEGIEELSIIGNAVTEILTMASDSYARRDLQEALRIEPLEQVIDTINFALKDRHIKRLCEGTCSVEGGVSLLELLTSLERISDHCSNIAIYILQALGKGKMSSDNAHLLADRLHNEPTKEYIQMYDFYQNKYKIKE
ncbi:Na/Pi cotransporter family protein [Lachnospiraceae bacterium NSJ-143]|nr:Na/Pi cotransporter family protein [Lachnospiraceae bacterium NSJ-143]